MKKVYALIITICGLSLNAFAQNGSLTFFSDKGERFWVLINSVVQNAVPESNVKISSLKPDFYRVKIVFQIDTLGEISNNINLEAGTNDVYIIKKKAKFAKPNLNDGLANTKKIERYVMRPFSTSTDGSMPTAGQDVIVYGEGAPLNTEQVVHPINTTVTTTTTTNKSTSTEATPKTESFSLNVNVDPNGGNMNVNVNGTGVNASVNGSSNNSSSTTTTTTTTSSNSTRTQSNNTTPARTSTVIRAMSSLDFDKAVNSIKAQTFEENKLMVAKQVLKSNYLNCTQIKTIMMLFTYETSKVDFAKAAYDRCVEKDNYYLIYEAFTYSTSSEEINEYIQGR